MLKIIIPGGEQYDETTNTFITSKDQTLQLEHSLVSLSKWESKWHKPFLSSNPKTKEEFIDYIRCMTLTQNVNPDIYKAIASKVFVEVNTYINSSMTATTFSKQNNKPPSREIITAEIIYYWMISYNIPFECQKWHLNRLLTLIHVCSIRNAPQKKMSQKELFANNRALNASRRKRLNTRG